MNFWDVLKRKNGQKIRRKLRKVLNGFEDRVLFTTWVEESILFVALPKSASSYICDVIPNALNINRMVHIGGGAEPLFLLNHRLVQEAVRRKCFVDYHLPANSINLVTINEYYGKMIVHVRDPRQATISNLHNILRNQENEKVLNSVLFLPENFFDMSFAEQLDYHIDHYLPKIVEWIDGWIKADGGLGFRTRILFTRYEDLLLNREQFFCNILDFYNIDHNHFWFDYKKRPSKEHLFRKGVANEWEEVFSEKQKKRVNEIIPRWLLERFGWKTT